jgi:hypothetical protein
LVASTSNCFSPSTFGDLDDRDVERPAAKVVHRDFRVLPAGLVEPERERGGGRLVDDPLHLEARDPPGVLGRLPLGVVEVRRDGDDRLGHLLAEIVLGGLLHLAQDVRRDLLRRDLLAADLDPCVAVVGPHDLVGHQADVLLDFLLLDSADEPLHCVDGVTGFVTAWRFAGADHSRPLHERDDRGRGARPFRVLDDRGRLPSRRRTSWSCRGRSR